jgi:hypothetical protein
MPSAQRKELSEDRGQLCPARPAPRWVGMGAVLNKMGSAADDGGDMHGYNADESAAAVAVSTAAAAHRRDHHHGPAVTCHPPAVEVVHLGHRAVTICHDCGSDSGFLPDRDAEAVADAHRSQTSTGAGSRLRTEGNAMSSWVRHRGARQGRRVRHHSPLRHRRDDGPGHQQNDLDAGSTSSLPTSSSATRTPR